MKHRYQKKNFNSGDRNSGVSSLKTNLSIFTFDSNTILSYRNSYLRFPGYMELTKKRLYRRPRYSGCNDRGCRGINAPTEFDDMH